MTLITLDAVFERQRRHRWVAKVSTAAERVTWLARLKAEIVGNLDDIRQALHDDLLRAPKAAMIEIGSVLTDIDDAIANLDDWMADTPVMAAPALGPATAAIHYEARGVCLLYGPWNFPFGLVFQPLVPIVAAGNTAIVKPNELAPATSAVTTRIIRAVFPEELVAVVEGGVEVAEQLLGLPADHVFFTGSPAVGKRVMARAAQHLASVTLELGGKCPAIVDSGVDVKAAATHIAIGKHQNAGQVCLSPDHVWVHDDIRDEFLEHYRAWVEKRLFEDGELSPGRLGKVIDRRNFDRITGYVEDAVARGATLISLGESDAEHDVIAPAVLLDVDMQCEIMQHEIFGAVLPVLGFSDVSTVIDWLRDGEKPLAMYVFSNDTAMVEILLSSTSSGGVTVNGWALHFGDTGLPFGGVGASGMGRYHGVHGFRELSHARSIVTVGSAD